MDRSCARLLAAPLPALMLGLLVMARAGMATATLLQNLAAALIGLGIAAIVGSRGQPGRRVLWHWLIGIGIVGLAFAQSRAVGLLCLASLGLLPAALLGVTDRRRAMPLAAYMATTMVAAWLGDYQVPVLGFGMSPILGYYVGVAWWGAAGLRESEGARQCDATR